MNRMIVEEDFRGTGVDLDAEIADDHAVDLDAAGSNQVVAVTSRADAGVSEKLIQAKHEDIVGRGKGFPFVAS